MTQAQPQSFAAMWSVRPVPPRTFAELAKAFDETKHKRDHGKFASENEPRGVTIARSAVGGAVAGALVTQAAHIHNARVAGDFIRYGGGLNPVRSAQNEKRPAGADHLRFAYDEKTGSSAKPVYTRKTPMERNKLAADLRNDRALRVKIKAKASAKRRSESGAPDPRGRADELASAAHRKVMEEAANDGRNLDRAKVDADRAADQVKRFAARKSKGNLADFLKATRKDAGASIKRDILSQLALRARTGGFRMLNPKIAGVLAGAALGGGLAAYLTQSKKDA